jgi:hypothetical protein
MANEFVARNGFISLGGVTFPLTQVNGTYTVLPTDYFVEATGNSFTINLPSAVGISGQTYEIKNSGSGVVVVDANGSQTIDGALTKTLNQYNSLFITSNGSNWIIGGANGTSGVSGNDGSNSLRWNFSTSGPASTQFTANTTTLSSITTLTFNENDSNGTNTDAWWSIVDFWNANNNNTTLQITKVGDNSVIGTYNITGVTSGATTWTLGVENIVSTGSLVNGEQYSVSWVQQGAQGTSGTAGSSGTSQVLPVLQVHQELVELQVHLEYRVLQVQVVYQILQVLVVRQEYQVLQVQVVRQELGTSGHRELQVIMVLQVCLGHQVHQELVELQGHQVCQVLQELVVLQVHQELQVIMVLQVYLAHQVLQELVELQVNQPLVLNY